MTLNPLSLFFRARRRLYYRDLYPLLQSLRPRDILEVGSCDGAQSFKPLFPAARFTATDLRKTPFVDRVEDVTALSFPDASFDLVLCVSVLDDVWDIHQGFAELKRVTRPGGHLLIGMPFLFPENDPPHDYWRMTARAVQRMVGWPVAYHKKCGHLGRFYEQSVTLFQKPRGRPSP